MCWWPTFLGCYDIEYYVYSYLLTLSQNLKRKKSNWSIIDSLAHDSNSGDTRQRHYRERENGIENIHPVGVKVGLKKGKKNNVHLQAESRES